MGGVSQRLESRTVTAGMTGSIPSTAPILIGCHMTREEVDDVVKALLKDKLSVKVDYVAPRSFSSSTHVKVTILYDGEVVSTHKSEPYIPRLF